MGKLEKFLRKFSEVHIRFILLGEFLILFSLGAILSRSLVSLSLPILLISLFISINALHNLYMAWYKKKSTTIGTIMWLYVGVYLLLFVLGIQNPQLPLQKTILIIGVLLMLPALRDLR